MTNTDIEVIAEKCVKALEVQIDREGVKATLVRFMRELRDDGYVSPQEFERVVHQNMAKTARIRELATEVETLLKERRSHEPPAAPAKLPAPPLPVAVICVDDELIRDADGRGILRVVGHADRAKATAAYTVESMNRFPRVVALLANWQRARIGVRQPYSQNQLENLFKERDAILAEIDALPVTIPEPPS